MPDYELIHAYETVNLHQRGGIAKIELNRPETMNAWNTQFGLDLLAAIQRVTDDDDVRAVVIVGAGRGFSSGADLKAGFEPGPNGRPDVGSALRERYHPIIVGVRQMPKPVVAAVHGPAVGIGLSLALASDLIVAADSAYFLLAFVNIGLVPDGGSSVFVPARVGFTRAIEMATLGERVRAPEALDWGLIIAGRRSFGLTLSNLTPQMARRLQMPSGQAGAPCHRRRSRRSVGRRAAPGRRHPLGQPPAVANAADAGRELQKVPAGPIAQILVLRVTAAEVFVTVKKESAGISCRSTLQLRYDCRLLIQIVMNAAR